MCCLHYRYQWHCQYVVAMFDTGVILWVSDSNDPALKRELTLRSPFDKVFLGVLLQYKC